MRRIPHRILTLQVRLQFLRRALGSVIKGNRPFASRRLEDVIVRRAAVGERGDSFVTDVPPGIGGSTRFGGVDGDGNVGEVYSGELVEPCFGYTRRVYNDIHGRIVGWSSAKMQEMVVS